MLAVEDDLGTNEKTRMSPFLPLAADESCPGFRNSENMEVHRALHHGNGGVSRNRLERLELFETVYRFVRTAVASAIEAARRTCQYECLAPNRPQSG